MNIAAALAEALRDLLASPREGQAGAGTKLLCGEEKLDKARIALWLYDEVEPKTRRYLEPRGN